MASDLRLHERVSFQRAPINPSVPMAAIVVQLSVMGNILSHSEGKTMASAASIVIPPQIVFPRVATLDDLRALDSDIQTEGQPVIVLDFDEGGNGSYQWDPDSLAADDDVSVIRPDDRTSLQAGRWLSSSLQAVSILSRPSGSASIGFLQAGTGAVARTVEAELRDWIKPQQFGADPTGVVNSDAAFNAAIARAVARGAGIDLAGGSFKLSAGGAVNFAREGLHIRGQGATLTFTGSGAAFVLDQGGSAGQYLDGMSVTDITIIGGASVTDGFYSRGVVRSCFRNIEVRDVTGKAFHIKHGVANQYDSLKYSGNTHTATYMPVHGIYLDNNDSGGDTGYYTANCTFINPVMELFTGTSCELVDASGNDFKGGTFEGMTGKGLVISAISRHNKFGSVWFEGNTVRDIEDRGVLNAYTNVYAVSNGPTQNVHQYGDGATYRGGSVRSVEFMGGPTGCSFFGVGLSENPALGFQGSATYTRIGCVKVDTDQNVSGTFTDIQPANKGVATVSLTAGTSGSITLNSGFDKLFWTKLGNRVFCNGLFYVGSVSSPVGELRLGSLPFGVAADGANRAAGSVACSGLVSGAGWQMKISPGLSYIVIEKFGSGGGAAMAADVQAGSEVYASFSYPTEL